MRSKLNRQDKIVKLVNKHNFISVDDLVKELQVSRVTIRRYLNNLESEGRLIRKFGGAVSIRGLVDKHTPGSTDKIMPYMQTRSEEEALRRKVAIAREAASLITNGSRILIDSGSTTGQILNFLGGKEKLTIMTNSLNIGYALSKMPIHERPKILLTGGTYDYLADTFQGKIINEVLKQYTFDLLFIGADGINFEKGTTTQNEGLSYSQVMADIAAKVVVLIESNKIGTHKFPTTELEWKNIDIIITDSKANPKYVRDILAKNIQVIIADAELDVKSSV